jgi:hypothetical protein
VAGSVRDLEVAIRRFEAGAVVVTSAKIPDARLAKVGAVCERTGVMLLKMQITFDRCFGTEAGPALSMVSPARTTERRVGNSGWSSGGRGWKMADAAVGLPTADGVQMSAANRPAREAAVNRR